MFISEGKSIRHSLSYRAKGYPGEEIAFDGNKVSTGIVRNGLRSHLSQFVKDHEFLVKEGLLSGTLATSWALLDVPGRRPRLEYNGLKATPGRGVRQLKAAIKEYHELRYVPRKGGGFVRVFLYFDPQTFRHVQTQYHLSWSDEGDVQSYTIIEELDGFATSNGLTLPQRYSLSYVYEGYPANQMIDWSLHIRSIRNNLKPDPTTFVIK